MRNTDRDWQRIGEAEPYWGVITMDAYKSHALDEEKIGEFYASGEKDVAKFVSTFRRYFGNDFRPQRALDFGCGVGRLAIAMARTTNNVTGVDVSPAMLRIAADNARKENISNIQFVESLPDA